MSEKMCGWIFVSKKEQKVDLSKAHKNPGFVKSVYLLKDGFSKDYC